MLFILQAELAIYADFGEILNRLKKANLKVKPYKCKFAQDQVNYLGHVVGCGACTPADAKVQRFKDYPCPDNKTQKETIFRTHMVL